MKNKLEQLIPTLADWTFTGIVLAVEVIIRLMVWFSKRLYRESKVKLTWKIVGVMTSLYLLIWASMTVFYIVKFNFFTVYANPVTKIYSEVERQNYFLRQENVLLKSKMKDLEYLNVGLENGDKKAVVEYIKIKFGDDWKTAVAVAKCESGLRANATNHNSNGTTDSGVFQINSVHSKRLEGKNPFSVKDNVDVAYEIYKEQSFTPWVCFSGKYYEKHLSSL